MPYRLKTLASAGALAISTLMGAALASTPAHAATGAVTDTTTALIVPDPGDAATMTAQEAQTILAQASADRDVRFCEFARNLQSTFDAMQHKLSAAGQTFAAGEARKVAVAAAVYITSYC